jgi:hypothetical protein
MPITHHVVGTSGGVEKLARIDQLYLGKVPRREAPLESFLKEHYTPGLVRDYYVFYPNSRAPIGSHNTNT